MAQEVERLRRMVMEQREKLDRLTKQVEAMEAELKARVSRRDDANKPK